MDFLNFMAIYMDPINPLKVIFPFYHSVSDDELLHLKHLYRVKSKKEFRNDIDCFLKFYKPLEVGDILKAIETGEPIRKGFLLTFDDGFRQVYDIVIPILKEKGVPAVFFINPAFLDNKALFFRCKASILIDKVQKITLSKAQQELIVSMVGRGVFSKTHLVKFVQSIGYNSKSTLDELAEILGYNFDTYLESEKPYLSENQVCEIIKDGFVVGSHSVDHPQFNQIGLSDQIRQVSKSLEYLNGRVQLKHKLFSFPFTDDGISAAFFQAIYNEQNPMVDLSFGTAGMKADNIARNFQRIPMEKFPHSASAKLLFQYFYWVLKIPFGRNEIKRY